MGNQEQCPKSRSETVSGTEESGLLLAIAVKTLNFRDRGTGNFRKNLTNRRGDMLMEAVTLHRRFPYAVLAVSFSSTRTPSMMGPTSGAATFLNAHQRLKLFTDRSDSAGREEQFERFYLLLVDAAVTGRLRPCVRGR